MLVAQLFAALFGAIVGSFLNAFSFRYGTKESVLRGRSHCMHCGKELGVFDLIPVISYLVVLGKCRYCRAPISLQYPLIEIVSALCSLFLFSIYGISVMFFVALFVSLVLLFVLIYDLRHMLLPMQALILLCVISIMGLFISCNVVCEIETPHLWDLLAGPVLGGPLLLISLISKGKWMGWGDGILELSLGWFLGIAYGLSALMVAFWSGAIVGIALIALQKRYTMKSEVPFAPFLIVGAGVAYFFHVDLYSIFTLSL